MCTTRTGNHQKNNGPWEPVLAMFLEFLIESNLVAQRQRRTIVGDKNIEEEIVVDAMMIIRRTQNGMKITEH